MRVAAARRQLCRAPLHRGSPARHGCRHTDEPLDILPLLLALQLGPHNVARPLLRHPPTHGHTPCPMAALHAGGRHHPEVAARRHNPEDRTLGHGRMARMLRAHTRPTAHQGIPPCRAAFRRHPLRRYRRLHTLALDIHILGRDLRRGVRPAHLPARPVHIPVGILVNTILRISLLLLHELPAFLRAGGACARGRHPDRTSRRRRYAGTRGRHADKHPRRHRRTA